MISKQTLTRKLYLPRKLNLLRTLGLLAMLLVVGACSQLPSFETAPESVQQIPEQSSVDSGAASSDSASGEINEITLEQLIVQDLSARPNMFALSKRSLSPNIKAQVLEALGLFKAGNLKQSDEKLSSIINSELDLNSAVYVLAGDIALAQSTETDTAETNEKDSFYQSAIVHYQKALSLNADNAKAANRLARLMREQGEFNQADTLYSQAINAQPMHEASYRNRAVLRDLYLNQKAQALKDYQSYAALLQYQQNKNEQGELALSDAELKTLKNDLKIVQRWLADLGRQVSALARAEAKAAASAPTSNDNNGGE
jgi:tetratricopeptide (TPR) repeat protein